MADPPLGVGDVFRRYGQAFLDIYGDSLSYEQREVLEAVAACRTPALGGHLYECDACGHALVLNNSCLNRHCPLCQGDEAAAWFDARMAEVLPVPYFHIVFTIPDSLDAVALQNKRVVYDILFRASAQTLAEIAADPKFIGAHIGFFGILHTWGENLLDHPHVHYVVPGGGVSPDGSRWISTRPDYFAPVRVLSRLFRGKLTALLNDAFNDGKLRFHGDSAHLAKPGAFHRLINSIRNKELVVYAKEPYGTPQQTIKYLARYTHRVAISNGRLVSIDNGRVSFRWKDYKNGGRWRTTTLDATEFIRRFLLHVLPKRFVRIRSYGWMANRNRHANLQHCRTLLGVTSDATDPVTQGDLDPDDDEPAADRDDSGDRKSAALCPVCKKGHLVRVQEVPPAIVAGLPLTAPWRPNTT